MAFFMTDVITSLARQRPDHVLLQVPDGTRRSAEELAHNSSLLAGGLSSRGLSPGDRVGVWLDDCAETVETYLALSAAGLVAVPLGKLFTADEASFILQDVDATGVVYSASLERNARPALAKCASQLRLVVGVGDESTPADVGYDELLGLAVALEPQAPSDPDDPMMIAYSSGTTGFPKGVVLTGRAIDAATRMSTVARRLRPWGTAIQPASLSFPAMVNAELFSHMRTGATFVLTGGWGEHVLEAVQRLGATYLFVPSPVMPDFADLLDHDPTVLRTLGTIAHGGSASNPDIVSRIMLASGDRFTELWGMIENSGGPLTATSPADQQASRNGEPIGGSVGTVLPGCEVKVLDPDGQPMGLGPDSIGELVVRSPLLFREYWHKPAETERVLSGGWYRTGDIGWIDGFARVYLINRREDVIISGGINVYPSELERVIAEVPGVREVVVVGAEHAKWGRTPVAVIIGSGVSEADVLDHCRLHLASYKKPTRVVFVDSFPRNSGNKVLRRVLVEQLDAS